jgi:hypothetical protein
MTALEQVLYVGPRNGPLAMTATSLARDGTIAEWHRRLEPWIQAGQPSASGYLVFGAEAALIRWRHNSASSIAHVVIGPRETMTAKFALRFPEWDWTEPMPRDPLPRLQSDPFITRPKDDVLSFSPQSPQAVELLVPVVAQILAGRFPATVPCPQPGLPESVMWGLTDLLLALGDSRPISFLAGARPPHPLRPGLFVSFPRDGNAEPADSRYQPAAIGLVTCYADHGRQAVRRLLSEHGILNSADSVTKVRRLLELWPGQSTAEPVSPPVEASRGGEVTCPVCLAEIDWSRQPLWHWDVAARSYVPLDVSPEASKMQRAREERHAQIRCPNPKPAMGEHYLPADYGRFGQPTIIGFVGETHAGKSHLLATMVAAIERGGLSGYRANSRPLDYGLHQTFVRDRVRPLLEDATVLEPTPLGVVSFVDAFIIGQPERGDRVVALFDVAGGDLESAYESKQFLEIVDGLVFVVDPVRLRGNGPGDPAFNTVLDLLRTFGRLPQVSAAIVVNKADLLRFEPPLARWLRCDDLQVSAEQCLRESADVFAYLQRRGAQAWTRPYREIPRATLHVASATGGADDGVTFPRGVTPCRVIVPLVALLAMTDVIATPQTNGMGI